MTNNDKDTFTSLLAIGYPSLVEDLLKSIAHVSTGLLLFLSDFRRYLHHLDTSPFSDTLQLSPSSGLCLLSVSGIFGTKSFNFSVAIYFFFAGEVVSYPRIMTIFYYVICEMLYCFASHIQINNPTEIYFCS